MIYFQELIIYATEKEEEFYEPQKKSDSISELLQNIYSDYTSNKLEGTKYILQKYWWWDNMKKAAYVVTTLWICYSLFLRWNKDIETLFDAINFGWDTDTYWSILWNMVWAHSWKFYSQEMEDWVQNIERIQKEVNSFVETILR